MTLSEYSQLKNCIIYAVGQSERHNEVLNSIKDLFKDGINSVRRFEQINTIGQLLNILEIRDLLSEDNVECLKRIALKLPDSEELLTKITQYEDCHVPRDYGNYYVTQQKTRKQQDESFKKPSNVPITNNFSERKKQRIFQAIIDDIGSFWRDLARNLKIKERDIDDIEFQFKTLPEKATQIMLKYDYDKANPDSWFFILCNALEKSRRKDIVRSIQEIMTMNI